MTAPNTGAITRLNSVVATTNVTFAQVTRDCEASQYGKRHRPKDIDQNSQ